MGSQLLHGKDPMLDMSLFLQGHNAWRTSVRVKMPKRSRHAPSQEDIDEERVSTPKSKCSPRTDQMDSRSPPRLPKCCPVGWAASVHPANSDGSFIHWHCSRPSEHMVSRTKI